MYRPDNLREFRRFVLQNTDGAGVHFFMADGVSTAADWAVRCARVSRTDWDVRYSTEREVAILSPTNTQDFVVFKSVLQNSMVRL